MPGELHSLPGAALSEGTAHHAEARLAFGVRGRGGAVRTSVTLTGQDIGNTYCLVNGLIPSSEEARSESWRLTY